MLVFLRQLFNREKPGEDGLTQPQREALLDLLVFTQFKDGHISEAEAAFVREEAEKHPWQSVLPIEDFYHAAVTRARNANIGPDARASYLDGVAARLDSRAARLRALHLCERLCSADKDAPESEQAYLDDLRRRLNKI